MTRRTFVHAGLGVMGLVALSGLGVSVAPQSALAASESIKLDTRDPVWIGPSGGRWMHIFYADGSPAYCVEPRKDAPASGTYTIRDIDATAARAKLIRAILYYSPGAPGFGDVTLPLWSSYAYNGQTATEMRKVDSHVMLAYVYTASLEDILPTFDYENWMDVRTWFMRNVLGINSSGDVVNASAPYQRIRALVDSIPDGFEAFEFAGSGNDQVVVSWRMVDGKARLTKRVSESDWS